MFAMMNLVTFQTNVEFIYLNYRAKALNQKKPHGQCDYLD